MTRRWCCTPGRIDGQPSLSELECPRGPKRRTGTKVVPWTPTRVRTRGFYQHCCRATEPGLFAVGCPKWARLRLGGPPTDRTSSLHTARRNSEFKFLQPFLPSLAAQAQSTGVAGNQSLTISLLRPHAYEGMLIFDEPRNSRYTLAFELLLSDPLQFFPIEVSVEDINDHSPVFPEERVTFKILENSEPGLHFPVEAAQDLDIASNDIQAYSINPKNEYFRVFIQSETAKFIELVLEKSLDREKQPEMDLNLIAIDGGSPPRTGSTQIHIVVLDANDNAPVFTQKVYSGHVFENAPEGSAVLKVVANDADEGVNGDISYQFSQSAEHSLFTVNSRTGEIIIEKPLDFETTKKHEFTVQAIDGGGLSSMCNVIVEVIDVNDNAPEIVVSSFNSPLLENVAPGTVVTLFAVRDQDSGVNGEITCALEEQLSFSLKQAFKNYYELVTVSALDREETAQHIVVVTAADAGSPSLTTTHTFTVDVSDVNDNAPVFNQTSYTMYVRENNVPALLVGAPERLDASFMHAR
ncbi:protocadherin beta-4-like [Coturnix japonica]|uniref:protocadherin beta-4-like n=1 Tax=Coturnix japonica TaxID=93934 RepID=UPI0007772CBD|nr:protocadherin beta-4-like [Coturnix japonica]